MLIARGRKVLRSLAAFHHGIGARLLAGVLIFSAFVTLILTALQLYIDYRRDTSALELRLNQIGESYLGGLAEGLWNLDESQLRLQLSGILRLPDIRAVEVREAGSTGNPLIVKLGATPTSFARIQEYPLVYTVQGRARTIGTLRVEATLAEVYRRLVDTALTILASQAAQTFLVSLFILYIFYHLVTRHLSSIAADLGGHRINGKPLELSLQRRPPRNSTCVASSKIPSTGRPSKRMTTWTRSPCGARRRAGVPSWNRLRSFRCRAASSMILTSG